MNSHPQAVLKTGLCLGCDNGVLTWKLISFFPMILVSLIKEVASLHRCCLPGGYHCDICHHMSLGSYGSFCLSPSQKGPDENLWQSRSILLCKTAVSGIPELASDELMVDTAGCSATQKCDLVSQSHETARISTALVQWHQGWFWRLS